MLKWLPYFMLSFFLFVTSGVEAEECQRVTDSPLSPCRAVSDIQLDRVEFDVQAINNTCHPTLIFHGDFVTLRENLLDGTVNISSARHPLRSLAPGDWKVATEAIWEIRFARRYEGGIADDAFGYVLSDTTYIAQEIRGFDQRELLYLDPQPRENMLDYRFWVSIRLTQGKGFYDAQSNKVPGPPQLLEPTNEFLVCKKELERREMADANNRARIIAQAAIEAQREIAIADKAFYDSEVAKYQEANALLAQTIVEASKARDEALASLDTLNSIYHEHLRLISNFWDDTESAYGDYFNRLIDSQVEINELVAGIEAKIASVQTMQDDITKLITAAEIKAEDAAERVASFSDQ